MELRLDFLGCQFIIPDMIRSFPKHIAVFLGAGASCFANFPAVDSFFQSVAWPQVGRGFEAACTELARRIATDEHTQENMKWPTFNAEKIFGWLETLEKTGGISGVPQRIRIPRPQGAEVSVDDLISHLRREIVRIYGHNIDLQNLTTAPHRSFFQLLDALTPQGDPLRVFTTNYDTVLEQLLENWSASDQVFQEKLRVCTGFASGRAAQWQSELFAENPRSGERLIHLVKLHGSVTWKKDNTNLPVETGWRMPTEHDCLLYFGYKSIPEEEPFITLHNLLKMALLRCETVIAVGFRFADPYIHEVFDFALRANPNLRVICSLTRTPEPGTPLSTMMARFPGRVALLAGSSGEPIPLGHERFGEILEKSLTATAIQ